MLLTLTPSFPSIVPSKVSLKMDHGPDLVQPQLLFRGPSRGRPDPGTTPSVPFGCGLTAELEVRMS